ncbi:MAG: S8 family serine peptidase [Bacteroidota bacterium]
MKKHFTILLAIFSITVAVHAQPNNLIDWHNKDLNADKVFGISTIKAYDLLKGKTSKPVIVAVIDAGIDTLHEDLKSILWINPKKKKGDNGSYGWSYIGSKKGNVQYDNMELTRQVRQYQQKDTTKLTAIDFKVYLQKKAELDKQLSLYKKMLYGLESMKNVPEGMITMIAPLKTAVNYHLNLAYDPRAELVGDDYFDSKERNYGSPDNNGPDPMHGTHVAGIIAASRNNGIGMDGIADNVKIMAIRAVPDGDERDKDIANAIRYATDHGAKVINMSFGKYYTHDKRIVDKAVKYALKKDVLLIAAAGNDNKNIDSSVHYPNRNYVDGGQAGAWIVVGASSSVNDANLKAGFSNYGKTTVDVFAPGVKIYSSVPGSKYEYQDGTSMASPVVAGLAAMIRGYYPKLTALQVKEIILKSVVKVDHLVTLNKKDVPFTDLCSTGGIVNALRALQLAATY